MDNWLLAMIDSTMRGEKFTGRCLKAKTENGL